MVLRQVLITSPPFVSAQERYIEIFSKLNLEPFWLSSQQTVDEDKLIELLPNFDGWILGDDLCNRKILAIGARGKLKAVVKWGIGVDNIDIEAINDLRIRFSNTPKLFGEEVADLAICYMIGLSRSVINIHNSVRQGKWLKIQGQSMRDKNVLIFGYGDIGSSLSSRCVAFGMNVYVQDPYLNKPVPDNVKILDSKKQLREMDFLVLCCPLTAQTRHLISDEILKSVKKTTFLINVSRGGLVDESAMIRCLKEGVIAGAALDVFESEPLRSENPLLEIENVIFGSHNASNTIEAVDRASKEAINIMARFLHEEC